MITINKIEFSFPAYIEWLKQVTYPNVALLAIERGTLDGCWESLIGAQLMRDCYNQNPMAFQTMEDCGITQFPDKTVFVQAGGLILNNKKIEL